MQRVMVLKGCPASGKSSFARELMTKEPGKWKRINNDDLRNAIDFSVWSVESEKHIRNTRKYLLQEFLRAGYNIIVDNVNASKRHFDDVCDVVEKLNLDVQVFEKAFYVPLVELIERDNKREGQAHVGEEVVKKFFAQLGKDKFHFYHPRIEIFTKRDKAMDKKWTPLEQCEDLQKAIIIDLDGTIAKIGDRSPYDASRCDETDTPNMAVVETAMLYHNAGHKLIFCSGRENKDRAPTERFISRCLPNVDYELYMRATGDNRSDDVVKEEIFNTHIRPRFNIKLVLDDRLKVVRKWYSMGLNCYRVGDPDACF